MNFWIKVASVTFLGTIGFSPLGRAQTDKLPAPPPSMALPGPSAEGDGNAAGVELLTRGPVHEAFAEQVSPDAVPGVPITKAPPEPVDEIPPDVKPEGDDVEWIPGYWFWDEDRNDFVWVTGVWRRTPPGRNWVPGYWQETPQGYQRVAGFWGVSGRSEVEYLEAPPASVDRGPSSPAPEDDAFWVPGCWVRDSQVYRWRAGYWYPYEEGWSWVCDHYVWTPHGSVYVSGYWDYALPRRGCLFTPVYFSTPLYRHSAYSLRPTCWVGLDSLLLHLFVRPTSHHYYFGDYYAPRYRQRQYYAGCDYLDRHRGYSPLYTYYRHHYRKSGIDYLQRARGWNRYYTIHEDQRPTHTLADQMLRSVRSTQARPHDTIAHRLERGHVERLAGQRATRITSTQQEALQHRAAAWRTLAEQRGRLEKRSVPALAERHGEPNGVVRDRLHLPTASVRQPTFLPGSSQPTLDGRARLPGGRSRLPLARDTAGPPHHAELPRAESPRAESPRAELPRAELPRARPGIQSPSDRHRTADWARSRAEQLRAIYGIGRMPGRSDDRQPPATLRDRIDSSNIKERTEASRSTRSAPSSGSVPSARTVREHREPATPASPRRGKRTDHPVSQPGSPFRLPMARSAVPDRTSTRQPVRTGPVQVSPKNPPVRSPSASSSSPVRTPSRAAPSLGAGAAARQAAIHQAIARQVERAAAARRTSPVTGNVRAPRAQPKSRAQPRSRAQPGSGAGRPHGPTRNAAKRAGSDEHKGGRKK